MKVFVDQDRCVGSGQCALSVPDVFDQSDDGMAVLLNERPSEDRRMDVLYAAAGCPALAITVER